MIPDESPELPLYTHWKVPMDEKSDVPVIDLSRAGKGNFVAKRGALIQILWFLVDATVMNNRLIPFTGVRVFLLRLFGARVGEGTRMPHPIRVKAPWNLRIGDRVWLGVDVWIYNQTNVTIGSDVCISQGSFLTTGSHEMRTNMDLRVDPIVIEDGVWISSYCVVQKGVRVGRSAVVAPLSVVRDSLQAGWIYAGNPVARKQRRVFVSNRGE